jgi:hypothetical protein
VAKLVTTCFHTTENNERPQELEHPIHPPSATIPAACCLPRQFRARHQPPTRAPGQRDGRETGEGGHSVRGNYRMRRSEEG